MLFTIFDYVNANGENEFKKWTEEQEMAQRAKLNERIDKLIQNGDGLFPNILTGTPVPGILKLRIQGNVKLRPLLCKGPVDIHHEYTMLMGAKEKGDRWLPKDAPSTANGKKDAVIADPVNRREKHERIS